MAERPRGPMPGWRPRSKFSQSLLADIIDRLRQHEREGTLARPPRGLFYDLRPHGFGRGITYLKHPPMRCSRGGELIDPKSGHCTGGHRGQIRRADPWHASPENVQEVLGRARRAGLVPEDWIADERAPDPEVPVFDDEATTAEDIAARIIAQIRDPELEYSPQTDQPICLEVLSESGGLAQRLARIAAPYGVTVYSGAGFDGLKAKRAMGERAALREVPTIVLRVADYDDHGDWITNSSKEDSIAWAEKHFGAPQGWLAFERIALTEAQARAHGLLDEFGKAEAEGLPVPVMDAIVREAIESRQDPAIRTRTTRKAAAQRERIAPLVLARLNGDEGKRR